MVPIVVFIVLGLIPISFSPVGRALARRIGGEPRAERDEADIQALQGDVADLRQELDEVQNRLDFAERLLTQAREKGLLGAPSER
ncbi:MAG TPA: hypothetical protein VEL75_18460 [Candidatus Methylomirabilis sp.]|nr:hypothetical protein [Candidatus Methylomirabilis sp.]